MSQKRHSLVGAGLASSFISVLVSRSNPGNETGYRRCDGSPRAIGKHGIGSSVETVIPNQDERLGEIVSANWR